MVDSHFEDPERYCLGLIAEELDEAGQIIGKAHRFGYDTPGDPREPYRGRLARELLTLELGDVVAAIMFSHLHGLIRFDEVCERADVKLAKLLDPDSVDNLGRRLAPPPPGFQ